MPARRTSLVPPNDIWLKLSDEEKKRIKKEEDDRIRAVEREDNDELLRRIDAAGPSGYKLLDGDTSMLLASYRLAHSHVHERAPFVLVRRRRSW